MDATEHKISNYLRDSRYFENIPEDTFQYIFSLARLEFYPPEETILAQGQINTKIYFIINGAVSVWVDNKFIYTLSRKGDIFGEMSVLTGKPVSAKIKVNQTLEAITISAEQIKKIEKSSSQIVSYHFHKWVSQILSDKLHLTSEKAKRYEDLSKELQKEVEARILIEEAMHESFETIKEQRDQMAEELEQARDTQKVLLPLKLPEIAGAQMACKYIPMIQIGGDLYDVVKLTETKYGLLVVDVTGHGIPAALVTFMISSVFKSHAMHTTSPAQALKTINTVLHGILPEDKFATMFYVVYDTADQTLTYAIAGHPPAMVIRPNTKEIFRLDGPGVVVGPFPDELIKYKDRVFQCLPQDKLLIYTDGIVEIFDQNQDMLGIAGIENHLKECQDLPIADLLEQLYDRLASFSNQQNFEDDITMVGLEIL